MLLYSPRDPRNSPLYQLTEDYLEDFKSCYDERYQHEHGYWRPVIHDVLYKFLDCGNLHQGFARVRCDKCGSEHLLAFSCKTRCFCPSCNQRRSLEFGELLAEKVLGAFPVRSCTFTIPKMLRPYFKFDHRLYSKLCRCAYETLLDFFQLVFESKDVVPGMVLSIHSFGNFVNHHPHIHGLFSGGCFDKDGSFCLLPEIPDKKELSDIFGCRVLKMMLREGKITELIAEKLMSWRHSGFNAHIGSVISPDDREGRERAARYLVRPPISLEKMQYLPEEGKVIYGKPRGEKKVFDAMDFLALATSHIANRFEHRVTYFGWWSNKMRGTRKKREMLVKAADENFQPPLIIEPALSSGEYRRKWAYFIKKVYKDDPLLCPKCSGPMRIVEFVEKPQEVKRILTSVNLWEVPVNKRAPPKKEVDSFMDYCRDEDPGWEVYCRDPVYEEDFRQATLVS